MSEKLCPFCGQDKNDAPDDCVCRSDELMKMTRAAWNTRPIEDQLRAENDALNQAYENASRIASERLAEMRDLKEQNERYQTALEIYADSDNWSYPDVGPEVDNVWIKYGDGYAIARESLEANNE